MPPEALVERASIVSFNPADQSIVAELPVASAEEVHSAVARARAAQAEWAARDIRSRLGVIRRFQELLLSKKRQVAELITREAGKPVAEALTSEIMVVLDGARFLLDNGYHLLKPEPVPHGSPAMKAKRGYLLREAYGVIGIIAPWNYPFSTPASETLPALVAGNAVVLKPSELTPAIALELQRLLHEAGVPNDVFQVVVGEGPTGAALVGSAVDKIIFTGSVATGKRVAESAAKRLLPIVLELGGKDAMIVFDDVDVDVVSSGAVWGAFMNAGQTCLSVERCYVQRPIYDKFLQACIEKTARLRVGNGMSEDTDVGPMISEQQVSIVEQQVSNARDLGAIVHTGGKRLTDIGPNFYAPTVISDVKPEMKIMREETFGPVLPIIPFATEDEAVRMANDSEFGLAASVWTRNRARGERAAAKLEAGTVMINDVLSCFGISEAPHGGVKASGIGRTHGRVGLEELVRLKYVDSDRLPNIKKVWWYGYGASFRDQAFAMTDTLYARGWGKRIVGAVKATGALWRKRL